MNRTAIKCSYCGQRVGQKEVMQTGHYPRMFGPSLVYVRYRCCRCKKIGEQFVKQDEWDSGILKDTRTELSGSEKDKFSQLGTIEMREVAEFHEALEKLPSLAELNAEFGTPPVGENPKPKETKE